MRKNVSVLHNASGPSSWLLLVSLLTSCAQHQHWLEGAESDTLVIFVYLGMEVEINYQKLSESPYAAGSQDRFLFNEEQVEEFVNDLRLSTPACYLISGYRGAGKTSLIKRVEEKILEENKNEKSDYDNVFVYTSFARYETRTHVVRKLIRELYLKIEKTDRFKTLSANKDHSNFKKEFETLYQQTFKEISINTDDSTARKSEFNSEVSINDAIKNGFKLIAPLLGLIPWYFVMAFDLSLSWIFKWLLPIVPVLWTFFNVFKMQFSYVQTHQSSTSLFTKTLFDDEIAATLFFEVISTLKGLNFKIVFVLDELDKVHITELDALMNEMKPYLICGYANFVVVGGQNLFYKFNEDENVDDAALGSLFAKVYHVSLTSRLSLENFFSKRIVNQDSFAMLNEDDRKRLETFIDYLIFSSKLVPRRFITLIRQNVKWRDKRAWLTDETLPKFGYKCKAISETIDEIDDKRVSGENRPAIRDYIIMKMFIECSSRLGVEFTELKVVNG